MSLSLAIMAAVSGNVPAAGGVESLWNSADKAAGVTLSVGDTVASYSSGTRAGAGSTVEKTSGKWYFEVEATVVAGSWMFIGISPGTSSRTQDLGQNVDQYAYGNGGASYLDTSFGGGAYSTYASTDVIGVAFDIDGDTIEFYKNNVSQGSEAVTFDASEYEAAVSMDTATQQVTIRSVTADLSYTPPSGYTPLGE